MIKSFSEFGIGKNGMSLIMLQPCCLSWRDLRTQSRHRLARWSGFCCFSLIQLQRASTRPCGIGTSRLRLCSWLLPLSGLSRRCGGLSQCSCARLYPACTRSLERCSQSNRRFRITRAMRVNPALSLILSWHPCCIRCLATLLWPWLEKNM